MAIHFSILPEKFHGQRSLAGYSPWGHKGLDTTEHTHTHETNYYLINYSKQLLLLIFLMDFRDPIKLNYMEW